MKRILAAILSAVGLVAASRDSSHAQTPSATRSPQSQLAQMPREVREEVDRVASNDAGKRATGAASLGQMGAVATPAIPYLVPLLDDATKVFVLGQGETQVALVAGESLVQIGTKGTEALISQLKRETNAPRWARCTAARVLGRKQVTAAAGALRAALAHSDVDDLEGLYIVEALAALGDSSAVAPTMDFLLARKSVGLWQFFQAPLKQLTCQDFKTQADALAWWEKTARKPE
jgi:hypothetical protein